VLKIRKKSKGTLNLEEGENQLGNDPSMGEDVKLWNEFQPNTYSLEARLKDKTTGKQMFVKPRLGCANLKPKANKS
jgi:hypothetical protein